MKSVKTSDRPIRVLAVCSHPVEAAATRFRLQQFIEPLQPHGIELTISPFLTSEQFNSLYKSGNLSVKLIGMLRSVLRRLGESLSLGEYDVILVQREAILFGPGIFEWIYSKIGRKPLVLDLDDATYVRYVSPTYGRIGSWLKFFGKTDSLIRRSSAVLCGNAFIADHIFSVGGNPIVIPTVVNQEIFKPKKSSNQRITMGWIGTHSTFPFLGKILPVLEKISNKFDFDLKVVGAGDQKLSVPTVRLQPLDWNLEREPEDFASLDIGLYPIFPEGAATEEWIRGKSGFKAIQYMACGVPFVMSPVGVCADIGVAGVTHFNAESEEDWYNSLSQLLSDQDLRLRMGRSARKYSLEHFGIEQQAEKIAQTLTRVARR